RELHRPRPPLGLTAFQAHGELARLDVHLKGRSRVAVPDVRDKDAAYLDRVTAILARLPDCRAVLAAGGKHPWPGCQAATGPAVPVCPAEWFATDPRAAAEAVVRLDRDSRRYRELVPTVPELDPAAARSADPAALDAAAVPVGKVPLRLEPGERPDSSRPSSATPSVRLLAAKLRDVQERLATLGTRATAVHDAARRAIEVARLNVPVPPAGE